MIIVHNTVLELLRLIHLLLRQWTVTNVIVRLESVRDTIGSSISRVKRDRRYSVTELSLSDVAGVPYEE